MQPSWIGVTVDCTDVERVAAFWGALLGRQPVAESLPGWLRIGTVGDVQPVLTFQPVPEPKVGKARLHLDLAVDDVDTGVAIVEGFGGRTTGERHDYAEGIVVVMADPEGNEFCLVQYFAAL